MFHLNLSIVYFDTTFPVNILLRLLLFHALERTMSIAFENFDTQLAKPFATERDAEVLKRLPFNLEAVRRLIKFDKHDESTGWNQLQQDFGLHTSYFPIHGTAFHGLVHMVVKLKLEALFWFELKVLSSITRILLPSTDPSESPLKAPFVPLPVK